MIKAEDLRIGDIVKINKNCPLKEGTIGYVTEIRTQGIYTKEDRVNLKPFNIDWEFGVWCCNIDPIPLTSEILTTNGWGAKQIGLHEFLIYSEDSDMYLEWSEIGNRYTYNDFLRSKNFITVKYVHELQHILWALGKDAHLKI